MIVAFDIETIPDLETGRSLYDLDGIGPEETAKAMLAMRRQRVPEATMLPLHLQRVVAISVAVLDRSGEFKVKSIGEAESTEEQLIRDFFRGVDNGAPTLVSWNGNGFDLPVLQYRALLYGIQSVTYWDTGQSNPEMRWNNYHGRFQERHLDLMDLLSRYQMRASAGLDDIARLLGFAGKIGVGGSGVFQAHLEGRIHEIRDYCEIDALNTLLIYQRLEFIRGRFDLDHYKATLNNICRWLEDSGKAHLIEFAREFKPRH